jgi:hypothetical protein
MRVSEESNIIKSVNQKTSNMKGDTQYISIITLNGTAWWLTPIIPTT